MMKHSLESSVAMVKQQREAREEMPELNASEASLLESYWDDMLALIMADREDENWNDEEEWDER